MKSFLAFTIRTFTCLHLLINCRCETFVSLVQNISNKGKEELKEGWRVLPAFLFIKLMMRIMRMKMKMRMTMMMLTAHHASSSVSGFSAGISRTSPLSRSSNTIYRLSCEKHFHFSRSNLKNNLKTKFQTHSHLPSNLEQNLYLLWIVDNFNKFDDVGMIQLLHDCNLAINLP